MLRLASRFDRHGLLRLHLRLWPVFKSGCLLIEAIWSAAHRALGRRSLRMLGNIRGCKLLLDLLSLSLAPAVLVVAIVALTWIGAILMIQHHLLDSVHLDTFDSAADDRDSDWKQ